MMIRVALVDGSVSVGDRVVIVSPREFELLTFLALRVGPTAQEILCEALWPGKDIELSRSVLKTTISRLRGRLGSANIIGSSRNGYELLAPCDVDIASVALGSGAVGVDELPPRGHLEAARAKFSRWAWAHKYEARLRELEMLAD